MHQQYHSGHLRTVNITRCCHKVWHAGKACQQTASSSQQQTQQRYWWAICGHCWKAHSAVTYDAQRRSVPAVRAACCEDEKQRYGREHKRPLPHHRRACSPHGARRPPRLSCGYLREVCVYPVSSCCRLDVSNVLSMPVIWPLLSIPTVSASAILAPRCRSESMLKEGPLFLSLQMRQSLSVRPMRWLPDWKISLTDLHGGGADCCKLLGGCSDSPYSKAF